MSTNESPTPETDAFMRSDNINPMKLLDLARLLEQQRDEARAEVKNLEATLIGDRKIQDCLRRAASENGEREAKLRAEVEQLKLGHKINCDQIRSMAIERYALNAEVSRLKALLEVAFGNALGARAVNDTAIKEGEA